MPMSETQKTIVLQLRPKWLQLSKEKRYSDEDMVDALCAFAKRLCPDVDPKEAREAITEAYIAGRNKV